MPKLEVILCTYNGELYLEKQLTSILNQTIPPYKISIYDDGSTDGTLTILSAFQKKHANVHLHHNTDRLGCNQNFEKGLRLATENLVALCDQDDVWWPIKIERQLTAIKELDLSSPFLIHHDLEMIDPFDVVLANSFINYRGYSHLTTKSIKNITAENGVMGNTIITNQALIKRALPFPSALDNHDRWLAMIAEACGKRVFLEQALISYRLHKNNTSNKNFFTWQNRLYQFFSKLVRKHYLSKKQKIMAAELSRRLPLVSFD